MSHTVPEPYKSDVALVVADDALRSAMRLLLTVSGLRVNEYRTVQDYLSAGGGTLGCLVVDCQLPDMPRRRLCDEIIKLDEHVPIVLVTAYPDEFDAARTGRRDIRIVSKPFAGNHLIEAVSRAIRAVLGSGPDAELKTSPP